MNNIISLNEHKAQKAKKNIAELDELERDLEDIDAEAVYRALFPKKDEQNIDNTLLRRHDRQKMTECFEAFSKARAVIGQSGMDWGK